VSSPGGNLGDTVVIEGSVSTGLALARALVDSDGGRVAVEHVWRWRSKTVGASWC